MNTSIEIMNIHGETWSFLMKDGKPTMSLDVNARKQFSEMFPETTFCFKGNKNELWLNGQMVSD